jgi:hypothetical protein
MARYSIIKPRRGTLYENSVNNVLLAEGELIVEVPDTGVGTGLSKFKIGDGITRYNDLPYAFNGVAASAIDGGSASESSLIQFRSDSTENWEAIDPILAKGEMGYDTYYKWFKFGDGVSRWTQLSWFKDVIFEEEDPDKEIVDFGDEDEEDPYLLSESSLNYRLSTGLEEYPEKILSDDWNNKIINDTVESDPIMSTPNTVDESNQQADSELIKPVEENDKDAEISVEKIENNNTESNT